MADLKKLTNDHFSFTKLVVGDLEKCADFYKDVCGLTELARVTAEIEGRAIHEIMFHPTADGASTFVLLTFPDAPKPAGGEVILGFVTPDIEAFVKRTIAAGGRLTQPIASQPQHGVKVAFVRDIEGHLIEVVEML
jgi:catechol 2,3-dioxygenase-like lactoylglutathione lyase family enzyme